MLYLVRHSAKWFSLDIVDGENGENVDRITHHVKELKWLEEPTIQLNGNAWLGKRTKNPQYVIGFRKALPIINAGLGRIGYKEWIGCNQNAKKLAVPRSSKGCRVTI